jgi:photosystem II stability/assembly factor-like uncharacterized protein
MALSWHGPALILAGIELGRVMRSTNGGQTWEDRKPGSYHDCHASLVHPGKSELVSEAAGGGVAVSTAAGASWQPADERIDRRYVWALAPDSADPDLWYVSATLSAGHVHGDRASAEALIYRRRGFQAWEPVGRNYHDRSRACRMPSSRFRIGPAAVYTGMRDGTLWESCDSGETWGQLELRLTRVLALAAARGAAA